MTDAERALLIKTAEAVLGTMGVLGALGGSALPGLPSMQKELTKALMEVRDHDFLALLRTHSAGRSDTPPGEQD